jgi:5-methylthioadenosine/S-adenosylhomocysteine deaminase
MNETVLIRNGIVATLGEQETVFEDGAILVKDDCIAAVGDTTDVEKKGKGDIVIDAKRKMVLPGFINTHVHSGLIRGTAEDLPLWEWLRKHVDPKHKALKRDDAYAAAELCYSEMIKAGITTALDMYRYMDRCADAAEETGIRVFLAPYVADKPGYEYFEKQEDNEKLIKTRHGSANGRINVWVGLEHLMYCSEEAFSKAREMSDKYGVGIHTHGEESLEMYEHLSKEHGKRPIEVFRDYGILGPKTVLAHCVWLSPTEMEILAKTNTSVAHCPVSNMKLASGVAPIPELIRRGVNVGLGSDGVKENNRLDLIQEMKIASIMQKVHQLNATVMPARQVLRMATVNGARALGMQNQLGSLEVGKKADIVIIDLMKPHLAPLLVGEFSNVVPNIVFAAQASDVETVLIDGKVVMEKRVLKTVNEEEVIQRATKAAYELLDRRKPFVPKD